MSELKQDSLVLVVGLTDHADGMAYATEKHTVSLPDAFTTCLELLTRCDHTCIISLEDYSKLKDHSYADLAPHSINISKGIYA